MPEAISHSLSIRRAGEREKEVERQCCEDVCTRGRGCVLSDQEV